MALAVYAPYRSRRSQALGTTCQRTGVRRAAWTPNEAVLSYFGTGSIVLLPLRICAAQPVVPPPRS